MYALDTNALIHAMKGMGQVKQRIQEHHPGDLAVPAIVAYELEVGTLRCANPPARRRDLQRVLSVVHVLAFDRLTAEHAARVRSHLEAAGEAIGPLDALIAGTALAHGATLITHNTNEFCRVPGLIVEDWY